MNVQTYDIGDVVRLLSDKFTDDNGVATNPTTVTCLVRRFARIGETADQPIETLTAVNDGPGLYHADYAPLTWGTFGYRWAGTGTVTTAEENYFIVRPSYFVG